MGQKKETIDDQQIMLPIDMVKNHSFAITGRLRAFTRHQAIQLIEICGGIGDTTVRKGKNGNGTNYLVIGTQIHKPKDGKTIKLRKAEQLGVKMLSEQEFYTLLKESF